LITVVSAIVMVLVSYMTAEPDYAKIRSLTFATQTVEDRKKTRMSWGTRDVFASCAVMIFILGAYIYFRG
jgi:hypothetical protein